MKSNSAHRLIVPLAGVLVAIAACPASAVQRYIAVPLGTLGGYSSYATAISSNGQVTGWSYTTGNTANHAFLYSGGVMIDLGSLGGPVGQGAGVNNSGHATGFSYLMRDDPATHAFLYSGGTMRDLGTLGGSTSQGVGINNAEH